MSWVQYKPYSIGDAQVLYRGIWFKSTQPPLN